MSEGAIANMVSSLKKRDIIFQVFFDGRNRGLRLHKNVKAGFTIEGISVHKNVKAGFTKRGKQVSRKNEHNNTENNTLNNTESERDAPAENQPSNLKEGKKEKTPLVAPPPSFPPGPLANLTDEEVSTMHELSRREAGELCLKISQSTAPLRYDQYPRPTNAKELREAMSAYFKDNPHEWSDGVLEEDRARNWNQEKIKSCVQEFCLHQEKTDNLKQKYSQYKAALTIWFRREERFNASVPAQGNGYSKKNEPSVIPINIQRFK